VTCSLCTCFGAWRGKLAHGRATVTDYAGRFALTACNDWRIRAAMSERGRIIAEVRGYDEFTAALRAWIAELGTTYECIDELAGLQERYLAKMIAATPVRSFSRMSLAATLGALCLKLLVVVDGEKLAAMRPRYTVRKKQGAHANDAMPTRKTHYLRGNSGYMSCLRHKGVLILSRRRRAIARHAAVTRWRQVRQ